MIEVRERNKELKRPLDIYQDKLEILFEWLVEFRYSNKETLARVLRQPLGSCERLFKKLRDEEWLQEFGSDFAVKSAKFLMLGPKVRAWMIAYGKEADRIVTSPNQIKKSSQVIHHIMVQQVILDKVLDSQVVSITSEFHMDEKAKDKRPDAYLTLEKGYKIAIEVERWKKDKARVYYSLHAHLEMIKENIHNGVLYFATSQPDRDFYKGCFDEERWPIIYKTSGRYKKTGRILRLPADINIRVCFGFRVLKSSN